VELEEVFSGGILQIHHACCEGFKGGAWGLGHETYIEEKLVEGFGGEVE
jgi:hypothetical protein